MSDKNGSIKKIEEKIDKIEKKIDEQDARLSKIEQTVLREKDLKYEELKGSEPEIQQVDLPEEVIEKYEEQKEYLEKITRPVEKEVLVESSKLFDMKNLELQIGKYLFQIIGVAIFLLGMGFLFKYSIEKGWIGPAARVIAGFVTATILLVGGELVKKRRWTSALIAGGIVLCYISLYAASNLYGLLPLSLSFVVALLITILAFVMGMVHDSLLITYFSLVGGFIAPLFSSETGLDFDVFRYFDPEHAWFVIAYLFLLSVMFVFIALIKRWYVAAIGSLLFMFLYMYTPMIRTLGINYQVINTKALYWVFVLLPYIYVFFVRIKGRWLESFLVIAGGIVSFWFHYVYIVKAVDTGKITQAFVPIRWMFEGATPLVIIKYLLFVFGFLYLAKTVILFIKEKTSVHLLGALATATIVSFFEVIAIHFKGFALGMMIQSYAVLLLLISFFVKNVFLRLFTALFLVFGCVVYLFNMATWRTVEYPSLIYNDLNLATVILIALFGISSYMVHRYKEQLRGEEKYLPRILEIGAYSTLFIWFLSPLWIFPYYIVGIALYALVLFVFGALRSKLHIRACSYTFLAVALAAFALRRDYLFPTSYFSRDLLAEYYYNFNLLCFVFMLVFVGYILFIKLCKQKMLIIESTRFVRVYELLLAMFLFVCVGRNIYLYTADTWYAMMFMSIYYGVTSLCFIFVGLVLKKYLIRYFGLYTAALTLWTVWFVIMGMKDTINRVIVFIVVGFIFMLASFIYQWLSKRIS